MYFRCPGSKVVVFKQSEDELPEGYIFERVNKYRVVVNQAHIYNVFAINSKKAIQDVRSGWPASLPFNPTVECVE